MTETSAPCPICGSLDCKAFHIPPYPKSYPFLPGGYDPLENTVTVEADETIIVNDRVVVNKGDVVAKDEYDALKKKHGPAEDRMRRPSEDR